MRLALRSTSVSLISCRLGLLRTPCRPASRVGSRAGRPMSSSEGETAEVAIPSAGDRLPSFAHLDLSVVERSSLSSQAAVHAALLPLSSGGARASSAQLSSAPEEIVCWLPCQRPTHPQRPFERCQLAVSIYRLTNTFRSCVLRSARAVAVGAPVPDGRWVAASPPSSGRLVRTHLPAHPIQPQPKETPVRSSTGRVRQHKRTRWIV